MRHVHPSNTRGRLALAVFSVLVLGIVILFPLTQHSSSLQAQGQQDGTATPTVGGTPTPSSIPLQFPADDGMINIKTDYGAKGDGVTDDTAAIQQALTDGENSKAGQNVGDFTRPKVIYFPAGTYLVSTTLQTREDYYACCNTFRGQGSQFSIIKLKDNTPDFADPKTPKAVLRTRAGNQSFHQNIWDLTVNTGSGNPGAIGIDYISNNTGSIRDVTIRSGDGKGHSGLDMTRQWAGPSLAKNVEIDGFDYGIDVSNAEYGPTFEHIRVQHQNIAGVLNDGNILAIRDLQSTNSVPAIQNVGSSGAVILVDGQFQGGSATGSAIENSGDLYARNVSSSGYQSAISTKGTAVPGTSQTEYMSSQTYSLFESQQKSLNLPIKETPTFHENDLNNWAKVTTGDELKAALTSGKSTLYFPRGHFDLGMKGQTVEVPATLQAIVGFDALIDNAPTFKVAAMSDQPLIVQGFTWGMAIDHASARPVAMVDTDDSYTDEQGAGDLFLEDVEGPLTLNHPHSVWARQLNSEGSDRTQVINNGATLWILGMKTEGPATVIETTAGGKTELLGTLLYPAQVFPVDKQNTPAFVSVDSSVSLICGGSSYVDGGYYKIFLNETRNGDTRTLLVNDIAHRVALVTGY